MFAPPWILVKALYSKISLKVCVICRTYVDDECAASECSLFCYDLIQQGRTRILIDTSVHVVYKWEDAKKLEHFGALGINQTRWEEIAGRNDAIWTRIGKANHSQVAHNIKICHTRTVCPPVVKLN